MSAIPSRSANECKISEEGTSVEKLYPNHLPSETQSDRSFAEEQVRKPRKKAAGDNRRDRQGRREKANKILDFGTRGREIRVISRGSGVLNYEQFQPQVSTKTSEKETSLNIERVRNCDPRPPKGLTDGMLKRGDFLPHTDASKGSEGRRWVGGGGRRREL